MAKKGDKPVIRLRSTTGQSISNVTLHLQLNHIWKFSCIYPEPSNTDGALFIQWNHVEVFSDGHLIMKQKHQSNANCLSHHYPSIDDELEYQMLFREPLTSGYSSFDIDNGVCVPHIDFRWVLNNLLKKILFLSEDHDDMINYILPQLDEIDPNHVYENAIFRFLSPNEYSNLAELKIRQESDRIIRAFLLHRLSDD